MRLEVTKPPEKPPGVPDSIWLFPDRLAELGNQRGVGRVALAKMAGVHQSTVTRWLQGQGLKGVAAKHLAALEAGLNVPSGTLAARNGGAAAPATAATTEAARRLGLDATVIAALIETARGRGLDDLSEELRRAILGVVHLLGYPLEIATVAARRAKQSLPRGANLTAEAWFALVRSKLPPKPASGTFPSTVEMKQG